ncbi:DUF983 domain-containing protein [Sphingomonas sp. LaA6.9]|uniref:DUF983 domain-containing protein n=1 Tax=Sphingomonas sp. LaA6.9 TaxID=2919914 RepID=UPI001F4F96ED|nr:DUF983 domain-containing protein [Sphingomonas sp. LaA6.9]MCJ8157137.1 DUF983 domain-containing protein [Sphingomonas sp. LaA6.9]
MPEPCDTTDANGKTWPKIDPLKTGPYGRCPRCGEGRMFASYLKLRENCDVCGLDYGFADPADGPAFFVLCFTCVPAVVFALLLEVYLSPPAWVHLLTSLPLILIFCLLPLRPLKGWLVASQFFFKAREARLVP